MAIFLCLMMFPAQLEVYVFFSLKVTVHCKGFIFFPRQKGEIFKKKKNIVYFIDSQVYGDNILQKF